MILISHINIDMDYRLSKSAFHFLTFLEKNEEHNNFSSLYYRERLNISSQDFKSLIKFATEHQLLLIKKATLLPTYLLEFDRLMTKCKASTKNEETNPIKLSAHLIKLLSKYDINKQQKNKLLKDGYLPLTAKEIRVRISEAPGLINALFINNTSLKISLNQQIYKTFIVEVSKRMMADEFNNGATFTYTKTKNDLIIGIKKLLKDGFSSKNLVITENIWDEARNTDTINNIPNSYRHYIPTLLGMQSEGLIEIKKTELEDADKEQLEPEQWHKISVPPKTLLVHVLITDKLIALMQKKNQIETITPANLLIKLPNAKIVYKDNMVFIDGKPLREKLSCQQRLFCKFFFFPPRVAKVEYRSEEINEYITNADMKIKDTNDSKQRIRSLVFQLNKCVKTIANQDLFKYDEGKASRLY